MSSRDYISPTAVCVALAEARHRIAAGQKNVRLQTILIELTDQSPRCYGSAIKEAIAEGLILSTSNGYRLTERGKDVAARQQPWKRPLGRNC